MACLKSLRTDFLSGADLGGVWRYTGPATIQVTITGLGTVTLNPSNIIASGNDNPELDFDTLTGLACGSTYPNMFTYTVTSGGCVDTAVVGLTISCDPDPGTDIAITLCETDDPVDILDQLGTTDYDGVISGDTANPGYSAGGTPPDSAQFDPGASGVGVFQFVYTITDTSADCPCDPVTGTLDITVEAAPNAGTGSTAEICL